MLANSVNEISNMGMIGLYLMLAIVLIMSPLLVNTALKQTKQDPPDHDKKH